MLKEEMIHGKKDVFYITIFFFFVLEKTSEKTFYACNVLLEEFLSFLVYKRLKDLVTWNM